MRILQFSGGLDSLATLWMLKETWDSLTVAWVDTGAAYDETHELMARIKKLPIADFVIIRSDQPKWTAEHGFPVDVIPVRLTGIGHTIHKTVGPRFQSYLMCCNANIWGPMTEAMNRLGATVVYRGQRKAEKKTAPIASGHVHEGIRYEFPIEDWTREQVRAYVEERCPDYVPEYYRNGEDSSRDCWDCTAYLEDNAKRISVLSGPKKEVVRHRLNLLDRAIYDEHMNIMEVLRHGTKPNQPNYH